MPKAKSLNRYDYIILPKFIEFPKISRLYSLAPIGRGTPFTESLSSYLTRLAQEHCVTPQKLIMGEIAPLIMGDRYESKTIAKNVSSLFGNSDAKPAINGMREMTRSLVDALENLTLRQDLRFLSCLTWKGIISDRSLFRQDKARTYALTKKQKYGFKQYQYCPNYLKHIHESLL